MGRTAAGVRGIRVRGEDRVISLIAVSGDDLLLFATEHGYGKRTRVDEFSLQGRGGQGVISIQTSERNGAVVGAIQVAEDEEVMLISNNGTLVRTPAADISVLGRNTQGVRLIRLADGEKLVQIEPVAASVNGVDESEDDEPGDDGGAAQ